MVVSGSTILPIAPSGSSLSLAAFSGCSLYRDEYSRYPLVFRFLELFILASRPLYNLLLI